MDFQILAITTNHSPEVLADGHPGGRWPAAKTAVAVPVASKAWLSFFVRPHILRLQIFPLLIFMLFAVSCASKHSTGGVAKLDAERLMVEIHPGMTVAQIKSAIPHSAISESPVYEHGGVFFDMTVSDDYIISFRVAHPRNGESVDQSIINMSPCLRDRKTLSVISGDQKPW